MGHKDRTFTQFFTDMSGVDAWQTIFAKIVLMIEMLWTTVAAAFLLCNYYMKSYGTFPALDALSVFLLIIAHLGATVAVVHMVKKLQRGYAPAWFDAWWLVLCILLDLYSVLDSRKHTFGAGETGDFLLGMGIVAVILSGVTFVLFIIVKNTTINQKVERTSHSHASAIPEVVVDAGELEQQKSQIQSSMPGVVTMRYPTTKFVHNPARKAE